MRDRHADPKPAPKSVAALQQPVKEGETRPGDAGGHWHPGPAGSFSPAMVQALQRTVGNAAVSKTLLQRAPATTVQRMPPNRRREKEKQTKKANNERYQQNTPRDAHQKQAIATSGKQSLTAKSGWGSAPDDVKAMLGELEESGKVPWAGLQKAENREFKNCAEAQLFAMLKARGQNPKHFDLTTLGADGHVAPPCDNCTQWVGKVFRSVEQGDRPYHRG